MLKIKPSFLSFFFYVYFSGVYTGGNSLTPVGNLLMLIDFIYLFNKVFLEPRNTLARWKLNIWRKKNSCTFLGHSAPHDSLQNRSTNECTYYSSTRCCSTQRRVLSCDPSNALRHSYKCSTLWYYYRSTFYKRLLMCVKRPSFSFDCDENIVRQLVNISAFWGALSRVRG